MRRQFKETREEDLILDDYNSFSLRLSSGSTTSEWHKLEKGINTGCTVSVILLNMLVKSFEVQCRGHLINSSV